MGISTAVCNYSYVDTINMSTAYCRNISKSPRVHLCNKSPSAIAVTIVAAIAGVRAYESVPLYADRYSGGYSGSAIVFATVVPL